MNQKMRITKNLKAFMCLILILSFITAVLTLPWSISYAQSNNIQNSQPDLIGVVKSLSGSKITIYIAKLSSQSDGRGFGRGRIELTNKNISKRSNCREKAVNKGFKTK